MNTKTIIKSVSVTKVLSLTLAAVGLGVIAFAFAFVPMTYNDSDTTPIKVAVVLFNYQNSPDEPVIPEHAKGSVFSFDDSVHSYYEEASFGKILIEGYLDEEYGDVFGWYTVPTELIDGDQIASSRSQVNQMAEADGFDENNYDLVIYGVWADGHLSSTAGLAGPNYVFVSVTDSYFNWPTVAHELGHTFSLGHAQLYNCEDDNGYPVALSTSCQNYEYGDVFSIMGSSGAHGHFNNSQKEFLGWLDEKNVQIVEKSGSYRLFSIESPSNYVQLLRIPKEKDAEGNALSYFDIEYRVPSYFDDFPSLFGSSVFDGVFVRVSEEVDGRLQTYLLDMTPDTLVQYDSVLRVQDVFTHPNGHFSINVAHVGRNSAKVDIKINEITHVDLTVKKSTSSLLGDGRADVHIVSDPPGIDCGPVTDTCTFPFLLGTHVTLTATPNIYTTFNRWATNNPYVAFPCIPSENPYECSILMNTDKSPTARYYREVRSGIDVFLTLRSSVINTEYSGRYVGNIFASPPETTITMLDSSSAYSTGIFQKQDIVTLTNVNALNKHAFSGWSIPECGTQDECVIHLNANETVTALYEKLASLRVNIRSTDLIANRGRVVSAKKGIDTDAPLGSSALYKDQTSVMLRAKPKNADSVFSHWSVPECGSEFICVVEPTIESPLVVEAYFSPK